MNALIGDARTVLLAAACDAGAGLNGDYAFNPDMLTLGVNALVGLASIEDRPGPDGGLTESNHEAILACAEHIQDLMGGWLEWDDGSHGEETRTSIRGKRDAADRLIAALGAGVSR